MVLFVVEAWELCILFGPAGAKFCCKNPGLECQFCSLEMLILVDQIDGTFWLHVATTPRSRLTPSWQMFQTVLVPCRMDLTRRRLAVLARRATWEGRLQDAEDMVSGTKRVDQRCFVRQTKVKQINIRGAPSKLAVPTIFLCTRGIVRMFILKSFLDWQCMSSLFCLTIPPTISLLLRLICRCQLLHCFNCEQSFTICDHPE